MNSPTPASLIVSGVYYILTGVLTLFSIFGLYILVRYGRSLPLAFTIAVVYSFFYLTILAQSYQTLHLILGA